MRVGMKLVCGVVVLFVAGCNCGEVPVQRELIVEFARPTDGAVLTMISMPPVRAYRSMSR
jgi:hypothetical protein